MDLAGIGVFLIGLAFLITAIFFARVLFRFSNMLNGVEQTVQEMPKQMNGILKETGDLIHHSQRTLADANEKMAALTPLFHIVGDVGKSTRKLTSSLVDVTEAAKKKVERVEDSNQKKRLGNVYGTVALSYYLWKKKKEREPKKLGKSLYDEGEGRALLLENQIKSN